MWVGALGERQLALPPGQGVSAGPLMATTLISRSARCPGRSTGVTCVWVPETPQTSRDLLILVDEPAEAVVSFDLVDLGCGVTGEWSCGSGLPQGAVRPVIVVVAFEFV
jgi:hypothetical protein